MNNYNLFNKNKDVDISIDLDSKIEKTINILENTFNDYNVNNIFLSFNGGKDCTALLHLICNFMKCINNNNNCNIVKGLNFIYVQPDNPFEEIESFVHQCELHYSINIETFNGSIKQALIYVIKTKPYLKACIMGTRRTDPYCSDMGYFQKTDAGWPDLMRISPLLDWTCNNIWEYLQKFNVPYCSLYDLGYTSLGDKTNTIPNPHLQYEDKITKTIKYFPAYKLQDNDELERAGRLK